MAFVGGNRFLHSCTFPREPVTPDFQSRLQATLDPYTIERELGGGGMSRVFVATERALSRRVVIKVLSPSVAADLSSRRFTREIRLAASLQQANIVPVLSVGETDGLPYYTMPFVEGLSLRDRLARGPLTMSEVIGVLRDVARALAYAHERGVVHRDIKPDNILLSGAAAVVTDFGIAKAISDARAGDGVEHATTVTQAGTVIGTPAYMAPEQIAADPGIDHRADLYSFGCVAYELLSGDAPFADRRGHQMMAHITERPVPVGEKRADCPEVLARMVMQCLEKEPAARPQSAEELLRVLDDATASSMSPLVRRLTRPRTVGAVSVGLALVAVAAVFAGDRSARELSVVVLPFSTVGMDSAQQYVAEGLADELATALGKMQGIRVVSRTLASRYRGSGVDAGDVGRRLAADYVLHGSVRSVGHQLRVSAQLTSSEDDSEHWAESYRRDSTNVFEMQNEITRAIATRLSEELDRGASAAEAPVAANAGTTDLVAYDLYLRGRFLLQRRGAGVAQSVERFEQAVARDSNFARAHASLALALQLMPYFENVRAASLRERTIASAQRALALDSTLAGAHTALAMAHQHAYAWEAAKQEYLRSLALEAGEADAHIQYGRFLFYTGRMNAALAEFRRARELDPYSPVASGWVGHLLDLSGRSAEGLVEINRALEIDSTNPPSLVMAAEAHMALGQAGEATRYMERLWNLVPAWRVVAATRFAELGDSSRALALVRALEEDRQPQALRYTKLSDLYGGLGDTARWLDALERATEAREIWPTYFSLTERRFDVLRGNPRFAAIVRAANLDERVFTSPSGGRPK